MPDYTEEDVEVVARAICWAPTLRVDHNADGSVTTSLDHNCKCTTAADCWEMNGGMRLEFESQARAALDAVPDLYTAGALAMKEAAAKELDDMRVQDATRCLTSGSHGDYMTASRAQHYAEAFQDAGTAIRALPVPPRGSKI